MGPIHVLILTFTFLMISSVEAAFIRLSYNALEGEVHTVGLEVTEIQPKLKCHFQRRSRGSDMLRRRYPNGQIERVATDNYMLNIKSSSLTEWLPGFDTLSCAYVLIVLGRDEQNRSVLGDIVLLGQTWGQMPDSELEFMKDSEEAHRYLQKRLSPLRLKIGNEDGRRRIVEY